MHKLTRNIPVFLFLSFVLIFAVGIALAAQAPKSKGPAANANTTTTKSSATTSKSTTTPKAKENVKKSDVLASAEDLSGTITIVDPSEKEVTVVANGVPYDFDLTRKTRVELSDKKIGVNELASETHKQATVHFVPTSRGNLADSIQISVS
jgi:hypothetical protein